MVARRIRFVNLGGGFGGVATAAWTIAAALIHFWPLVAINTIAMLGYGVTVFLNYRRKWRAARHMLFWSVIYHMTMANTVLPGWQIDAQNWFLMVATAAFFLPDRDEIFWRRFYAILGIILYFLLGFNAFGIEPIWQIPAGMERIATFLVQVSFVSISAYLLMMFYGDFAEAETRLELSSARARGLLRNILPASISDRLESGETTIAEANPDVTVMFADIVGFTPLAQELPPEELVEMLNGVFTRFDDLALDHGVEKIKTIGDAYMVAAGVPVAVDDHAIRAARFALAIRDTAQEFARDHGVDIDLRIGIHTGPVVAGVIGKTKFSYDLWGDAVNTAARMESHSEPGQIQVSEASKLFLEREYDLVDRGEIEIKGKGKMRTWFLGGPLQT